MLVKSFGGVNRPILVPFLNLAWDDFMIVLGIFCIFALISAVLVLVKFHMIYIVGTMCLGIMVCAMIWHACRSAYKWFESIPRDGTFHAVVDYVLSPRFFPSRFYGSDHYVRYKLDGFLIPWKITSIE